MKSPSILGYFLILMLVLSGCMNTNRVPETATLAANIPPTSTAVPTPLPSPTATELPSPTPLPTLRPISEADTQGWWRYTHPEMGFSLQLPTDWVVDETTGDNSLLNGHLLEFHPQDESSPLLIRMTFRWSGEDTLLWPTGVGAGEFREFGTLEITGKAAKRMYFICPTGQVNSIWYMGSEAPELQSGTLEFGFLYGLSGHYCEDGYSLDGKDQFIGELIISSLQAP